MLRRRVSCVYLGIHSGICLLCCLKKKKKSIGAFAGTIFFIFVQKESWNILSNNRLKLNPTINFRCDFIEFIIQQTCSDADAGFGCAGGWGVVGWGGTAEELISSPAWLPPLRRDLPSAGREQSLIRGVTNPHFWGSYCNSQAPVGPPPSAGAPASREGFETTSLLPAHCATLKVVGPPLSG